MKSFIDNRAKNRVEEWLKTVACRAVYANTPLDTHIDEFSPKLRDKFSWIPGGLELLGLIADSNALGKDHYFVCLVIYLDSEVDVSDIGVQSTTERWNDALGITPPEIVIYRTESWIEPATYLREFGRIVGVLPVKKLLTTVYLTERFDRYGETIDAVRHIWIVLQRQ